MKASKTRLSPPTTLPTTMAVRTGFDDAETAGPAVLVSAVPWSVDDNIEFVSVQLVIIDVFSVTVSRRDDDLINSPVVVAVGNIVGSFAVVIGSNDVGLITVVTDSNGVGPSTVVTESKVVELPEIITGDGAAVSSTVVFSGNVGGSFAIVNGIIVVVGVFVVIAVFVVVPSLFVVRGVTIGRPTRSVVISDMIDAGDKSVFSFVGVRVYKHVDR